MLRFTIRRFLQAIPTIIGVTVLAYFVMWASPGNPATQLVQEPNLTPAQRTAMIAAYGFDKPFIEQYARWLIGDAPIMIGDLTLWEGRQLPIFDTAGRATGEMRIGTSKGILRGDFGNSIVSANQRVTDILGNALPATLELGLLALIVGLLIGIPVGVLAAVNQGGLFDQITRVTAVIVSAIPVFWLGLMLILIFGVALDLLPMGNRFPTGTLAAMTGEYTLWDRVSHLILPVFTLASLQIAGFSRYMRNSLLDVLNQDYVRTARSKGLANRRIWFIHALRNALIPIATLLGPSIAFVIAGAPLTETIYAWPGMGRMVVASVFTQDFPIIMAVVLMFSIAAVLGYLMSDLFYALLDPRIRLS